VYALFEILQFCRLKAYFRVSKYFDLILIELPQQKTIANLSGNSLTSSGSLSYFGMHRKKKENKTHTHNPEEK
jgi:hypothetical protein